MNRAVVVLAVLAGCLLIAAAGYFYWTTTPMYAFQEAGLSYANHNLAKFEQYVDLDTFISSACEDLFYGPISRSPQITEAHKKKAQTLLEPAKGRLNQVLADQARKYISNSGTDGSPRGAGINASPSPTSPPPIVNALMQKVQAKAVEVKESIQARLAQYVEKHQNSFLGRLLVLPEDQSQGLKQILNEYGFTAQGFRGIDFSKQTDKTCIVGFKFFSPKVNHEIHVETELASDADGLSPHWQIKRLSNLSQLMTDLEPTYEGDMQTLALQSVSRIQNVSTNIEHKFAVQAKLAEGKERLKQAIKNKPSLPPIEQSPDLRQPPGLLGKMRNRFRRD